MREWHVTLCGGWSPELELRQIGINRVTVERNTSLDPGWDRVRVALLGGSRGPVFMERFFEVVPLDGQYPGALKRSPMGEAVFPEGDEVLRRGHAPQTSDQVLLNNVGRRLDRMPGPEAIASILQDVLSRKPGGRRGAL